MSALEGRVKTLENHFDINDPESFLSKFNKLFNDFQDITDEWQVNLKLTVGEIDPKVVIEDGKVDGRDVSEDGKVLGTINNTLTLHANNQSNPHRVTAEQAKALPIAGGTINGNISATEVKTLWCNASGALIKWLGIGENMNQKIALTKTDSRLYIDGNVFVEGDLIADRLIETHNFRELTSNISKISSKSATDIITKLDPVKYRLKNDKEYNENLGFIAEDVPDILSDKDHKTVKIMDIVAALVKVVQEQQKKIEILENK